MAPLNPISFWQERGVCEVNSPAKKYFFICEGSVTEKYYFKTLFLRLNKMRLPILADLVYVERTEEAESESNPAKLKEHADSVYLNQNDEYDFEQATDRIVVIFDADIYKDRPDDLHTLIYELHAANYIIGITQPSIELFLLLHRVNAYEDLVAPYEKELFENKKERKRRFIDRHFSEAYGLNPKNKAIGALADSYELAIDEERKLNNSIEQCCNSLTSNIGQILSNIIEEGRTAIGVCEDAKHNDPIN